MWLGLACMLAKVGSWLMPEWSQSCRNTTAAPISVPTSLHPMTDHIRLQPPPHVPLLEMLRLSAADPMCMTVLFVKNRVLLFVKVPIMTEKRNQVSISNVRDHWRRECQHKLVPLKRCHHCDFRL